MSVFLPSKAGAAMRERVRRLVGVSAFMWASLVSAQPNTPGKLGAEFSVSPTGAAIFRVPIQVPPGVAGVKPQLALVYNSHAGNGLMGAGWSLEGLSAVTRCAKTMPTDGMRGRIQYNVEDRFCLDGQRLINVAGAYGSAGSEYRTEVDSFKKVLAVGSAGGNAVNGPERFDVFSKEGMVFELGGTVDARMEAQGKSAVHAWSVSRMRDVKGNAIDFSYFKDAIKGIHRLERVSYANRSVRFEYESRPDISIVYIAGAKQTLDARLMRIRAFVDESPVMEWRVVYSEHSSVYGSLPASLQQCTPSNQCTDPVVLSYRGAASGVTQAALSMTTSSPALNVVHTAPGRKEPNQRVHGGDFNGDGLEDLVLFLTPNSEYAIPCDEGGCITYETLIQYRVMLSNGIGGFVPMNVSAGFDTRQLDFRYAAMTTGDINGDGISDLIAYDASSSVGLRTMVATGTSSGAFTHHAHQLHTGASYWALGAPLSLDLNGDGRSDLLMYYLGPNGLITKALLSNGVGGFSMQSEVTHIASSMTGWELVPTELNGDGITDLLVYKADASGLRVRELHGFPGGGFSVQAEQLVDSGSFAEWLAVAADVNGDGQVDFFTTNLRNDSIFNAGPVQDALTMKVYIRKGEGSYEAKAAQWFALGQPVGSAWNWLLGDFNHDGRLDVMVYGTRQSQGQLHMLPFFFDEQGLFVVRNWSVFGEPQLMANVDPQSLTLQAIGNRGDGSTQMVLHGKKMQWVCGDHECNQVAQFSTNLYTVQNNGLPRLMTQAASSASVMQWTYGSQSSPSVHTREPAGAYPLSVPTYPIPLVATSSRSNGLGGVNAMSYSYGGLKAEHASAAHPGSGRGVLGFRWMKSKELATGIEAYTEYSQTWPTIGGVVKSETRLVGAGSGGVLNRTTNTHGCILSHSVAGGAPPASATAPCGSWAAGKVYAPVLQLAVEEGWDLNGAQMPQVSTSHIYGGYPDDVGSTRQFGDPTQITVDIHHGGVLKHRKQTVNEYYPAKASGNQWQLGRLKKATVSSSQY
ncbi:MAG: hypothetical protein GTN84_06145 [Hydrogenophaga sp.]|uniref:FG-GAP-like repeat-containing protein n=1 Tax=Hydrogenophaga sp. TaxID=1904254 RepID=UPI0016B6B4C1|nr:FG-GAP-like repeat-containing protein [Hydrogenophaga sp.]NIM40574.1 hypothetical protein [Hydrogenophaga sp.]NIN25992.1 hypothetical protein [Hydrogenophaga sp.]NIN30864.1 hypothetical protein [Hydrogenophaga sp.]NIN54957.1 hypothetical protein [Hydrogenophaga sp.]NIO50997.1 hypothetical protein [Hydrogenophaga sp.]